MQLVSCKHSLKPADSAGFIDCERWWSRKWSEYRRLPSTTRFVEALPADQGKSRSSLIVQTGGTGGHTFTDKRIALHLAAWISPEFEVWVFDQIEESVRTEATRCSEQASRTPVA
jgi:hypothetical protein